MAYDSTRSEPQSGAFTRASLVAFAAVDTPSAMSTMQQQRIELIFILIPSLTVLPAGVEPDNHRAIV